MTPPEDLLAGIDLVVFDKDGTLIDFQAMWSGWVRELADRAAAANGGARLDGVIDEVMGVDAASGRIRPDGGLAATPMASLRTATVEGLRASGVEPAEAERIVVAAWHAPDPVALARPVTDLVRLFEALRAGGRRLAVVTSDDREPTARTLEHLGLAPLVDALACADDGPAVKPSPDAVHWACVQTGIPEARTAVVGDSPADMAMGRAAGAGRVIGVLTGVADEAVLAGLADAVVPSVAALRPDR